MGLTLLLLAVTGATEETPNQIRRRLGIAPGEPIPEERVKPARRSATKKRHRPWHELSRSKEAAELDRAAEMALAFFQHYYKGEGEKAWKLLSAEVQNRMDYRAFCSRSRRAAELASHQPSAGVGAVIGQRSHKITDSRLSEGQIEKAMEWNRLNHSVIVYLRRKRPAPVGHPEMFVVKPIEDRWKIVVIPRY